MTTTAQDDEWQRCDDRYYAKHGACCAGCDHWHSFGVIGECRRSAPVSAAERYSMVAIARFAQRCSTSAGHIVTDRSHICGEFKDECDWSQVRYLKRPHRPKWLERMPPSRTL